MSVFKIHHVLFASVFTGTIALGALAQDAPAEPAAPEAIAEPQADPAVESDDAKPTEPQAEPAVEETPVATAETPEATAAAPAAPFAGYDGGFFIQSPDKAFKLKINGMGKLRYSFANTLDTRDDYATSFSNPYARLLLTGNLFGDKLTYSMFTDFGGGHFAMIYLYVDYAFKKDVLHLTVGQFKRPYSRVYLASSVKLQFIDGANIFKAMTAGHGVDMGLQLSNNFTKVKGIEWALGMFNGANAAKPTTTSEFTFTDTDEDGNITTLDEGDVATSLPNNGVSRFRPILVGRIGYNNGIKGYELADLEGGPFRFGIGAAINAGFDADDNKAGDLNFQADLVMKLHHFSLSGAVYEHMVTQGGYWESAEHAATGVLGQMGFVIVDHVEPIVRYSVVMPKDLDAIHEVTGGLTFYFHGHNFKWENNFTSVMYPEYTDVLYISQLQFFF